MYKIIPFILLIYWSFFSYSQTTFNKIYSPCGNNPTTGFAATSILSKGSGYIISGTVKYSPMFGQISQQVKMFFTAISFC